MSMTHLSEVEIKDLIGRYTSELNKLTYQASKVQETITDLKQYIQIDQSPSINTEQYFNTPISPKKMNVAEVLGSNEEVDLPETGSGYRLSEWDYFVLDSLKEARMTLVNSDFFKLAAKKIKIEGIEISRSQLHGKINRSIHKLTHKRGILIKVQFSGKGFAYALSNWLDENGKLLLSYKRKSIRSNN